MFFPIVLEFTPLEFETTFVRIKIIKKFLLEFTPLEFETASLKAVQLAIFIRIYSVGV